MFEELKGGSRHWNPGIKRTSCVAPCRREQWPEHAGPWEDNCYSVLYSKSAATALTRFSWRVTWAVSNFSPCCENELEGDKDGCWEASYEVLKLSGKR